MAQKKLMLLGGLRYLLPVIDAAHKLGHYVITCDYLPDNIAHKYSDEYANVSIIDKEAVLEEARKRNIDGIMSFAVDPGVVTAAYVADRMGLPMPGPYESVCILQNKDRFRKFLADNGFNVPKAKGYSSIEEAMADITSFAWPVIVKPTDSAGSKGVTKVNGPEEIEDALKTAFAHSISKHIIVEDFIEKQGFQTGSDSFLVNGTLKFFSLDNQYFDDNAANIYTPSAHSWPSSMPHCYQNKLQQDVQRIISLLNMGTSIFNIETRIGTNGKPYIMEMAPRAGGNRLSEVIRMATGLDIITASIEYAVGNPLPPIYQAPFNGSWLEVILHSNKPGKFAGVYIDEEIKRDYLKELEIRVKPGENIRVFKGANDAIGVAIFQFEEHEKTMQLMNCVDKWIHVKVE